jgi:hypothetical protein
VRAKKREKRLFFFFSLVIFFFSSALLFSRLFLYGDDEKAARARGEELKREKRKLCTDKPMRVFSTSTKAHGVFNREHQRTKANISNIF